MATKRDLVEAHAFSRRRLVTAFVSGAPGGREVEPVRPGRTIVGGLALAVLLVVGAVIAGVFAPRTPEDWNKVGLVVSKDDGGLYAITEAAAAPVLRPVINVTSAKLILGEDAADPTPLSTDFIQRQQIGEDIGILGAPTDVPAPSRLVGTGWTACTDSDAGVRLDLTASPDVSAADATAGLVVEADGDFFVIAQAPVPDDPTRLTTFRYRLPSDSGARDNMLTDLGLGIGAGAVRVPPAWLALFPAGGDLSWQSMGLRNVGEPVSIVSGTEPTDLRVGDIVLVDGDVEALLLTDRGPAPLTAFARAVYENLPAPHTPRVRPAERTDLERQDPPYASAHWPEGRLTPVVGEACALLDAGAGQAPRVSLRQLPGERASAADVVAGQSSVRVDPGGGAYVLAGGWDEPDTGTPFLVDARGRAYPLIGDAAVRLGYGGVAPSSVPDGWLELLADGVPLSRDAALCPPEATGGDCS